MNDPVEFATEERHVRSGKIFARIHRYRNLLVRRWWILLLTTALALGLETAYLKYSPTVFTSVGQMIVSIKLNLQQGSFYTEELSNFLGTQAALMQGSEVTQRARERVVSQNPALTPKPVLMNVSVLPKTTIFILRASGENPEYNKAFLQACMEEYISFKHQMVARTSDTTIAGLTEQVMRLEPELQKCDNQLQIFLSTNDVTLLEQAIGLGGYITSLYQQLASAQAEADLLEVMTLDQNLLLEQGRNPLATAITPANSILVNAGLEGQSGLLAPNAIGTEYLAIKQQIQLFKADRDRFAKVLKSKHPQMVVLDQQIDKLSRMLEIFRAQSEEQLDAKKSALRLRIKNLENQLQERGKQNLAISRKAAQYERLKAKSARVQSLYDQLLATLQTLDVNKEINPESVTIYQSATDSLPDLSLNKKGMIIAGLLGLGLGFLILILLDRVDDRLNSFTELEEQFDEDVLGQIPRESKPGKDGIIPYLQTDDKRHPFVEAYRNLRSSLLYMASMEPRPKILLLTSSIPGDGKSLTATNLAITLAQGGSRVLLVDADLRKGNLHKRLSVETQGEAGFSEVFLKGAQWKNLIKTTGVTNLSLLPRGATTQRSSEFFIGADMDTFLKEAGEAYDYVLIDTAPVMAADDVTSLAPRVDGVIFVIRAEHTSSRVAHAALNMLYQRKAKVLGLVFNSVHARTGDYYYYNRYEDYHKD